MQFSLILDPLLTFIKRKAVVEFVFKNVQTSAMIFVHTVIGDIVSVCGRPLGCPSSVAEHWQLLSLCVKHSVVLR